MKQKIRHRRLYAFCKSKVLNALMIIIITYILLMVQLGSLLPTVCCATALACFAAYSLWLWIKRPGAIVINDWLAGLDGWFTLYFLIVMPMKSACVWWYVVPAAGSIIALTVALTGRFDEQFEI